MIRIELFQTNGKCTIIILFCLLRVTQGVLYCTQVIVAICDIKMIRIKLFQTNGKCTIMILFCLLRVTQGVLYYTQQFATSR